MFSRYLVSHVKHNSFFLFGLVLGLWLSLIVVPLDEDVEPCVSVPSTSPLEDEYEPHREEKPPANVPSQARSIQRPRYYSTELGMRGSLLTAVLTSEQELESRAHAINHTASQLQPALRFFITASALQSAPGRANVVGFTDTREMLKPFHALKYLADNYLEEYNFFFLVTDNSFINAPRIKEIVSALSTSQDVYMGVPAEEDSHYCSLESGIIVSNSVLRAVHSSLDWCVRNSYSAQHHENVGRCIVHAAKVFCSQEIQGSHYSRVHLTDSQLELTPELGAAATAGPLSQPNHHFILHTYVSRLYLEGIESSVTLLRRTMRSSAACHPEGFRRAAWPPGVRGDPGLPPPTPLNRFDHVRWTLFNSTHAMLPDDLTAIRQHSGANKKALEMVLETASAWADLRWPGEQPWRLVSGASRWRGAAGLAYRLLLRGSNAGKQRMRQVEVFRGLGGARLVPVRYVTESGAVTVVVPVTPLSVARARHWPAAWRRLAHTDQNVHLIVVLIYPTNGTSAELQDMHTMMSNLPNTRIVETREPISEQPPSGEPIREHLASGGPIEARQSETAGEREGRLALKAILPLVGRDTLILLSVVEAEFSEDFINRVRMNCVSGEQWFSPVAFARFAQFAHPQFVDATGRRPQHNTGRFAADDTRVLAVYRRDLENALATAGTSLDTTGVAPARVLASSSLRTLRAPEPGLVLSPPPRPAAPRPPLTPPRLQLGARHELAKLLLQTADGLTE